MTATLFDCPACDERRERADALDAELRWLRQRVAKNDSRIKKSMCERCPGGSTDLSGAVSKFGFDLIVCVHCWRPGDRFPLRGKLGVAVDVASWRQVILHLPEGPVWIDLDGQGSAEYPTWAMSWRAVGAVTLSGGGPGVGCMAAAVRAVLAHRNSAEVTE